MGLTVEIDWGGSSFSIKEKRGFVEFGIFNDIFNGILWSNYW